MMGLLLLVRPRGLLGEEDAFDAKRLRQQAADVAIWLLLLSMPYWLDAVGGYTQLGSRVLIMALAAMSLKFLLGYTGVLSFGHAAYFGLAPTAWV